MKQLIILVTLAVAAYAAKMPVEHVPVVPMVPVVVDATPVPVVATHKDKIPPVVQHVPHDNVQKVPQVPTHVQHVVEQVHQHVPQVVNHHVGTKKDVQVPHVPHVPHVGGVVPLPVPVPMPVPVTVPASDVHQHHNVPHVVAADKKHKVEQHIQQVMQQTHQHIPQVINHHIAQHSTTHGPHGTVQAAADKVPHVTPVPGVEHHAGNVQHHPVVTVKTTSM